MSDITENTDLANELSDHTYTAVTYLLRQLGERYFIKIGDTLTVNNALIQIMARMVGEMIACYPENEREETFNEVMKSIVYSQDMMVLTLSEQETDSSDDNDLSRMTPKGNC